MKKGSIIFFLLLFLSVISCDGKKVPQAESENPVEDCQIIKVDNYLKGNRYHMRRDKGIDLGEIWGLRNDYRDHSGRFLYGMYIHFDDSLHYKIYNTAPCGNDCFFSNFGKYHLRASDTLIIFMDSIVFAGECADKQKVYGDGKPQIHNIFQLEGDSIFQVTPIIHKY